MIHNVHPHDHRDRAHTQKLHGHTVYLLVRGNHWARRTGRSKGAARKKLCFLNDCRQGYKPGIWKTYNPYPLAYAARSVVRLAGHLV